MNVLGQKQARLTPTVNTYTHAKYIKAKILPLFSSSYLILHWLQKSTKDQTEQ